MREDTIRRKKATRLFQEINGREWLGDLNESAAESLKEALEEILTLHWLKVPALLRKILHSTNPIEGMFSTER